MRPALAVATLILAFSTAASADGFRPIFHPPTISILEALQQDPDSFSTLIGLLKKSDLKELRDAKASHTLLAPTNEAFAKLAPEDLAKLSNDPDNLKRLLLGHLLPGKVLFKTFFAPDKGGVSKQNVTKSIKTTGGGLAEFQCNEHPADPANEHRPLINQKARGLKSDIEGTYAVIQIIDTVLVP